MKKEFTEGYHGVFMQPGDAPVFCYRSGLTVYEEVFADGTLNAAGWNAAGYPLNVLTNYPSRLHAEDFIEPNAFGLTIDGECCDRGLTYVGFEDSQEDGKTHAIVTLRCSSKPVCIKVHTVLDGTPVFSRWLEVENASDQTMAVSELAVMSGGVETMPLSLQKDADPEEVYSLGYMDSDMPNCEGDFSWHKLMPDEHSFGGSFARKQFRYPMFLLRNNVTGTILTGQLAWGAGYKFSFDYNAHREKPETNLSFRLAMDAFRPLNVLQPGECMVSPVVHIGIISGDLDDAVNAMHNHMRKSVFTMPEADARACLVGSGMGPEHDMSVETTKQFIDQMALAGAEVFIIDAGWYCPPDKEREWWHRVGLWEYDKDRYPNGIDEIREYCHQKGMKFAMWMESERLTYAPLCQAHPDWFPNRIDGKQAEFFLDFSNPQVVEWVEAQIAHVISDYKLDMFRVDYNVNNRQIFHVSNQNGRNECRAYRHVQGYLGMYHRLHKRFPNVIFENCASGGGRCDAAMIANFNHTWVSDNQVAPRSALITNGMTMVIPPERVDRLVAGMGCHKRASLDFHMRNAMLSHMTLNVFGPRAAEMNPDVFEFIRHSVQLYKEFIRPYLPDARIFHHTPDTRKAQQLGYTVLETAAPDTSRSCVGIFSLTDYAGKDVMVYPKGLSVEKTYRVGFDNSRTFCKVSGWELMQNGVKVKLGSGLSSELLTFEAVE